MSLEDMRRELRERYEKLRKHNPNGEYVLKPTDLMDIQRRADLNLRRIRGSIGCLKDSAEECDLHRFLGCFMVAEFSKGGLEDLVLTVPRDKYVADTWQLSGDLIKEVHRFADKFERQKVWYN